jgi:hypothetical protein
MNPEKAPQNQRKLPAEEFIPGPPADPDSPSERFYAGAIRRIHLAILVVGVSGCVFSGARYGMRSGTGFVLGAAISYWNFRSLVSAVISLASSIVNDHAKPSGASIVFRFIVRIPLVALAGYGIFISSPGSLRGFLAGLCVPVAAILWEAGYEAFAALRRGF